MTYEMRLRPAEKQWDDWVDAQWAKSGLRGDRRRAG